MNKLNNKKYARGRALSDEVSFDGVLSPWKKIFVIFSVLARANNDRRYMFDEIVEIK